MLAKVTYPDRRRKQRFNGEFEISLLHQVKGMTKNVSANGASFEVITDNVDTFHPGAIIPLEIATVNMALDSKVTKLCLSGKGLIVCREVIDEPTRWGIKLNIAVQFMKALNMKALNFWAPSNN